MERTSEYKWCNSLAVAVKSRQYTYSDVTGQLHRCNERLLLAWIDGAAYVDDM